MNWLKRLYRGWVGLILGGVVENLSGSVIINEIHYRPDVKNEPAEFVELHNPASTAVDISGWRFSSGIEFTFPAGTRMAPGSYLVVAENPAFFLQKFKAQALGPFVGRLASEGERIELRNANGSLEDEVDYQLGFPWPTVGEAPGNSIELIHPALDNNLGGSWRASSSQASSGGPDQPLIADHSNWKYQKGLAEASEPATAWRQPSFDDAAWLSGSAPLGYGENFISTVLSDMRGNYTCVFLRKTFQVENPASLSALRLEVMYDDGFKVWINGTAVLSANVATGEISCTGTANSAREDATYNGFSLGQPTYLRAGANVMAIQVFNSSRDSSSDMFFDARLKPEASTFSPSPGQVNSVFSETAPPQVRQVQHTPKAPRSGTPVLITAKVTDPDGVAKVTLEYQLVNPGSYIELADAAYLANWISVVMQDDGLQGDAAAQDDTYSVELPAALQTHRRLVRYRLSAQDQLGHSIRVPYRDDPQPNFAYFVYQGVPAWRGAIQPGSADPALGQVVEYSPEIMQSLPVYHLISKKASVENATWLSRYGGDLYNWKGTLVYDGEVYDHVGYRARGGVWRYSMVKNMWKFDFPRGHAFQARNNFGSRYPVGWTKLNLGACIQQGDYNHRGEQGLFESVGFRLFALAGLESPRTHYVQFRVIDEAEEAYPNNQYEGDFWGLYLAIEQEDGRFLEAHNLPDGNFYKMEGGVNASNAELNNQGFTGVSDKSDLNAFIATYKGSPSDAWWQENLDLPRYYSYRAIVEAIHHYDIDEGAGKNYFYYLNPLTQRWSVHPWDLDLTWANNMYGGGNSSFKNRVLPRAVFDLEYRNHVREIRDLLFNADQADALIEEYAGIIDDPQGAPSMADADRAMWDYNPKMNNSQYTPNLNKAGQGRFYQFPNESGGNPALRGSFRAGVQIMKNYVNTRGAYLDTLSADAQIPSTPTLSYGGPPGFPANRLAFRCSAFQGTAGSFAAQQWRLAEVTPTNHPAFDPATPRKYEIQADWDSGRIASYNPILELTPGTAKVGRLYRVRARLQDSTGRWSHWSAPIQFLAAEVDQAQVLDASLRLTELMYNPPGGSDYEFIELHNLSPTRTLDLSGLRFTQGVTYTFAAGVQLPPLGYLLVVRAAALNNFSDFRSHYQLEATVPIVGPYQGALDNAGETLTLKTSSGGTDLISVQYSDGRGWPLAADGAGHSLVPRAAGLLEQSDGRLDYGGNWRMSAYLKGSPGREDPVPAPSVVLNEFMAHTDYFNVQHPEYDSNDWIELYNLSPNPVNLAGWYLSDDAANLTKWAIPAQNLTGQSWLYFDEVTGFHHPINTGFGLDKAGEQIFLSHFPGTAQNRVVDAVSFKGQENDVSQGRHPDGGEFWSAMPLTPRTANQPPLTRVVITEMAYHPLPGAAGVTNDAQVEFVELYNPTSSALPLFDTNGVWRLDGDVDYLLPTNTVIAPKRCLLLVGFNPTNSAARATFLQYYQLTNLTAQLVGPYTGPLPNGGGRVALEKPQWPDLPDDPFSWVIVDELIYGDCTPWPLTADGTGHSLQRLSLESSANDPANWVAAAPTPGAFSSTVEPVDTDGDGMPDDWESAHGLNPTANDAALDPDQDGQSNLAEYQSGTDPQNPASCLRIERIEVRASEALLQFSAMAGKTYQAEYRDSVASGDWTVWARVPALASMQTVTLTNPMPPILQQRFYRVRTP